MLSDHILLFATGSKLVDDVECAKEFQELMEYFCQARRFMAGMGILFMGT